MFPPQAFAPSFARSNLWVPPHWHEPQSCAVRRSVSQKTAVVPSLCSDRGSIRFGQMSFAPEVIHTVRNDLKLDWGTSSSMMKMFEASCHVKHVGNQEASSRWQLIQG